MRVLGIDPGTATTGFGVVDKIKGELVVVNYGAILTSPQRTAQARLLDVYNDLNAIIDKYAPDEIAMERLFFTKNQTTGIAVAKSCGVMQLVCAQRGLNVTEYTPPQVKLAVVGYGDAEKKQVQYMIKHILRLKETPKPDDAADALAIAVGHLSNMRGV